MTTLMLNMKESSKFCSYRHHKTKSLLILGHGQDHKTLSFLEYKGPVSASMTIKRTGYVPGEDIKINAKVENLSNTKMKVRENQCIPGIPQRSSK